MVITDPCLLLIRSLSGAYVCQSYEDALTLLSTPPLCKLIHRIWNVGGAEISQVSWNMAMLHLQANWHNFLFLHVHNLCVIDWRLILCTQNGQGHIDKAKSSFAMHLPKKCLFSAWPYPSELPSFIFDKNRSELRLRHLLSNCGLENENKSTVSAQEVISWTSLSANRSQKEIWF